MSALKEFANFITLNMANLSATYARLLAEQGQGYETFQADHRQASARRMLKAVIKACQFDSSDPLCHLFDGRAGDTGRWVGDVEPPQPLLEVECLGQTLTPVVPNLEAGKFLWQTLSEVRTIVFQTMARVPPPASAGSREREEKAQHPPDDAERQQVEEQLRKLSRAVEQSANTIVITDTQGYIEYVNPKFTETAGYTPEEAIGQHTRLLKSGETSPEEYKRLWQTITAGHEWRGEFHNKRKNGELYWESVSISPIKDESGVITHFLAVKEDITEQKQVEAALRQANLVVENSPVVLFRWRAAEGWPVEFVSENVARFGYTPEELLTGEVPYASIMHPDDLERVGQEVQTYSTSGVDQFQQEYRIIAKDGQVRWTDDRTVIERDTEGRITHYQGIVIDITERRQAEEALREGESRYRSLFEDSPISLWEEDFSAIKIYLDQLRDEGVTDFRTYFEEHPGAVVDCAMQVKIVDVNQATLELYQAHSKEEFFAGLGQVFGEESFDAFKEELIAFAEGKTRFEIEAINYTLTGIRKDLVLRAFVAPDYEGTLSKVLITMVDITGRKQLEQQVQELLVRRTRQVETSTEIAQEIALAPALDDLFRRVVNLVQERFGYYHAHVYLLTGEELVMQEGTGEAGRQMKAAGHKITLAAEESLVARAARIGQPVLVPDVSQEPSWLPNPLLPATKSELAVPIKLRDEVLGVLDVQSAAEGGLTQADLILLMGLCGQIAVAINNRRTEDERKQAEEALAKRAAELEAVAQVSTAASTTLEADKLLQEVADLTKERFDLYHAHIYLLSETGDRLNLVAGAGDVGRQMVAEGWSIPLEQEQSLVVRVARTRQGVIFNDVSTTSGWLANPLLPDTRSEMAVPLIVGDRVLGVLDVQADVIDRFTDEDVHIQTTLAAQVAAVLENARLLERTQIALTEVQQSQQLLRSIIDATPDWIFIKDQEHRYRLANRGYADALHLTPDDFIGKNDLELGFPEELVKGDPEKGIRGFWADDRLVMDSGETQIYPNDPATIDGVIHTFHTIKTPLRDANGEVWGVLAFARDITEREQLLADVQQSKTAAENRLRETQILQELTQTLAGTLQVDEVIEAFFQACTQLLGTDYAIFSLVDQEQQRVKAVAGLNVTDDHLQRANHPVDSDDIMADIIRTGQTEIISGWDARFDPENFEAEGMAEWGLRIFTPITLREEHIGLIEVGFKEEVEDTIRDNQVRLLRTLVDQTVIALESAQRYEASQNIARRERILHQVTAIVNTGENLVMALPTIVQHLRDLVPVETLTVASYIPGQAEYTLFAVNVGAEGGHFAQQGLRLPVEGTCPGWVITHDEAWLEEDFRETRPFIEDEQLVAEGMVARLVLPVRLSGRVIGTLNLGSTQAGAFREAHLPLLEQMADQMASALERSRLFQQIGRQAERERTIREITDKMRAATSLEELIKTTTEELGQRFSAEYALVELGIETAEENGDRSTNGH